MRKLMVNSEYVVCYKDGVPITCCVVDRLCTRDCAAFDDGYLRLDGEDTYPAYACKMLPKGDNLMGDQA